MSQDPGRAQRPTSAADGGHMPSMAGPTAADGQDWTDQVTNLVVDSVDKVRDRTTGPILEYSRASVHLVVALMVALPMFLLLVLGLIRLLTWGVRHVWISYAIIGVVLIGAGAALWSRRSKLPI